MGAPGVMARISLCVRAADDCIEARAWYEISVRSSPFPDCAMAKPAVFLVGADKGGVGKTTVARTLLDYFGTRHVPARAFE